MIAKSQPTDLHVEVAQEAERTVVTLLGQATLENRWEFESQLRAVLGSRPQWVVLDTRGLQIRAGACLSSLIAFTQSVKGCGGRVFLVGLQGALRELQR